MSGLAILVIGHRNPDTDAIASAVGYAWVLNESARQRNSGESYLAARTGKVSAQTAFALGRGCCTDKGDFRRGSRQDRR